MVPSVLEDTRELSGGECKQLGNLCGAWRPVLSLTFGFGRLIYSICIREVEVDL